MSMGQIELGKTGPGSNSNEGVLHILPDLQNWSLTIKCNWCHTQEKSDGEAPVLEREEYIM